MNIQRFKWPVIIAASLHGALFLVMPDTPAAAASPVQPRVVREIPLNPEPVAMPEDPHETDVAATAGGPRPLPTTPEVPPVDLRHADFTVPVEASMPSITIDRRLDRIPSLPFGREGDGSDGPSIPRNIVDSRLLDRAPRAVAQPSPDYPRALYNDGVGGSVTVEFVVDMSGRVVTAEAVRWTHREFVDPAVRAVLRWRFEPGTIGGRKVRFRMAVPMEFNPG